MPLLPAVEIETKNKPDASIIWLHGLGASGNDFVPIVPELKLPDELGVRFIFPHAPMIPVTVNGGFVMRAWYDILEMEIDRKVDGQGLMASAHEIEAFVENELNRGIDSQRIILAGFSQGGAVAYQVALSHEKQLGGLLVMSTYFATADSINFSEPNRDIPIEIQHGTYDTVVPEVLGQKAANTLSTNGYDVNYKTYPVEHGVCPQQVGDISTWLQNQLK